MKTTRRYHFDCPALYAAPIPYNVYGACTLCGNQPTEGQRARMAIVKDSAGVERRASGLSLTVRFVQ